MTARGGLRLTRRGRWALVVAVLVAGGATAGVLLGWSSATLPLAVGSVEVVKPPVWGPAETVTELPPATEALLVDEPHELAPTLADALLTAAPVVVAVGETTPPAAEELAAELRAPLLPAAAVTGQRLRSWETATVVVVGAVDGTGSTFGDDVDVVRVTSAGEGVDAEQDDWLAELRTRAGQAPTETPDGPVLLMRPDQPGDELVAPLLELTGARRVSLAAADPRGDEDLRAALTDLGDTPIHLAGTRAAVVDVSLDDLDWQLAVARAGEELPGGGQLLFPGRTLVALYGSPGSGALGVLGEQPVGAAIDRARRWADEYAAVSDTTVVPAFEIITTIAAAEAGPDNDYSRPVPLDVVEAWVDAAGQAGVYVVLDLQPGRTDFLTQARTLESLLTRPHVGLALDPEWRLEPDQVHLRQIGSVSADEVNEVARWLADLTREHALPQKLLLLHQFKLSMIRDRSRVVTPPELAVAIQMDGQGPQGTKLDTWRTLTTQDPPAGVHWGWKNFFDEDPTLRSPADTLAVEPTPVFVSYQ